MSDGVVERNDVAFAQPFILALFEGVMETFSKAAKCGRAPRGTIYHHGREADAFETALARFGAARVTVRSASAAGAGT